MARTHSGIRISRRKFIHFSRLELEGLFKSWLIISLAFAIVFSGPGFTLKLLRFFLISLFTAGIGFILHELAHKFTAQYYGCWAEYHENNFMLGLALITSLFGIIFAAPGAVFISGRVSRKSNGIISLAGPLMNFFLAIIFLIVYMFSPFKDLGNFGYMINSWLFLFNLIPFGILDGKKVYLWNRAVWAASFIIGILLVFGLQNLLP